ncbi:MAG: hypothetical protein N2578_10460 [Bdellovibrionaceae bacterium]|nr:hypothetical protein [Pseudobdellovibrionaceae bacterium]
MRSRQTLPLSTSTYYGFIVAGSFELTESGLPPVILTAGMYFSTCGSSSAKLVGQGHAVVIERLGYRGIRTFGGPVESKGRLTYIETCSSSILIPPARAGDPCTGLNFLDS